MHAKHSPYLIKQKCTFGNVPPENELVSLSKLISIIEDNLLIVLNRIYECSHCILNQYSHSVHPCFMFNIRENFQKWRDIVLMIVKLDSIVSLLSTEFNVSVSTFI